MVIELLTVVNFREEGIGKKYEGGLLKLVIFHLCGGGHIGMFTVKYHDL